MSPCPACLACNSKHMQLHCFDMFKNSPTKTVCAGLCSLEEIVAKERAAINSSAGKPPRCECVRFNLQENWYKCLSFETKTGKNNCLTPEVWMLDVESWLLDTKKLKTGNGYDCVQPSFWCTSVHGTQICKQKQNLILKLRVQDSHEACG